MTVVGFGVKIPPSFPADRTIRKRDTSTPNTAILILQAESHSTIIISSLLLPTLRGARSCPAPAPKPQRTPLQADNRALGAEGPGFPATVSGPSKQNLALARASRPPHVPSSPPQHMPPRPAPPVVNARARVPSASPHPTNRSPRAARTRHAYYPDAHSTTQGNGHTAAARE